MKRILLVSIILSSFCLFQTTSAQIFVDFENEADTTNGFFKPAGWGDLSSLEWMADPTGRSNGVMAIGIDVSLSDKGVVQSYGRDPQGATIAGWHIWLPEGTPDSLMIQVWGDDNVTGWNFNYTQIFAFEMPKETWFPIYFLMEQIHEGNPTNFDPFDGNILAHFGLQFAYDFLTGDDASWSDTIYVDDATFYSPDFAASIEDQDIQLPRTTQLYTNYPNPFNPTTNIAFDLTTTSHITLKVYNMLGQEVKTLINETRNAGHHLTVWDGTNNFGHRVTSGIYFYVLSTGETHEAQKMVLMK